MASVLFSRYTVAHVHNQMTELPQFKSCKPPQFGAQNESVQFECMCVCVCVMYAVQTKHGNRICCLEFELSAMNVSTVTLLLMEWDAHRANVDNEAKAAKAAHTAQFQL